MEIISALIYSFVFAISMLYIASKLSDKTYNYKDYKFYIFIIIFTIFIMLNYIYTNSFVKVILIILLYSISIKFLLKEKLINSIILAVYYEIIIVISEAIFALFINVVLNMNAVEIVNTLFGNFWANIIIDIISIIMIKIKGVKKFYKFIISTIEKINAKHIILLCLFVMIVLNVLEATLYYDFSFKYLLIFNVLIIMFCFAIILYSFNANSKYNKVSDKYNITLNSLKEYEDILDRYRINNHENKNQLLTLRNMISKKNKRAINYIDEIINNKLKDNEKLMSEVNVIPAGGLRGLIYSKLLYMNQNKIYYNLNISKKVKTVNLINNITDSDMSEMCEIIGVYIDNAIDAVNELKKKQIFIEMFFEENTLIISISNNYKGNLELDKFDQKGYTTKGNNRGYGLSLVKQIINNNKKFSNERCISGNMFSQILKIKM